MTSIDLKNLKTSEKILIAYFTLLIGLGFFMPKLLLINISAILGVILSFLLASLSINKSIAIKNHIVKIGFMWIGIVLFLNMIYLIEDYYNMLSTATYILIDIRLIFLIILIPINALIIYSCKDLGYNFESLGFKFSKNVKWSSQVFDLIIMIGLALILVKWHNSNMPFRVRDFFPFISLFIMEIIKNVLVEEVLFRGMLFSFLTNIFCVIESKKIKYLAATFFNTLIFLFSYVLMGQTGSNWIIIAITVSILGCFSRLRTGSIYWAVILHAIINVFKFPFS